jgi:hypothetical protein
MEESMIPTHITVEWLRTEGACSDQIEIVQREWGDAAPLTRENLLRAVELRLDLDWLADELLLSAEPLRVYREATAEAWRVYRAAKAEALRVYRAAKAEALRVYEAATAEALWAAVQAERKRDAAAIREGEDGDANG